MASVRKKTAGKQEYYYLEHSFRERGKIQKKEKYLGKTLPDNLEELKRQIIAETYRDKWLDLFDKIKKEYSEQEKITPPSAREKETENFIIKFTYDTNRIEGSKLTFRETSLLLEKGITPNEKTLRDVKEAESHRNAFYEMLSYEKELSLNTILYFHKKLFEETKKDIAGKLRQHQVAISGSRFMPSFPAEVYPLLMDFFRWYGRNKDRMHPVELAALVHLKLVTIHPFADGNGRISRLIMNFVLHRHGFPMLNIPYEKRSGYYNALEKSQIKKDETVFLQWLFKRYLNEHRQYLKTSSNGKHNVLY
ncbi:MAG: Fic family protein [Candidatus Methanoperedens sp.]|nr:Fic family protein [Candidatus Methanoperedens sp.]